MTKVEIKEQLAAKKLALETLLQSNNLSLETALTTEQLAIVEQVYGVLGVQDIGRKTFVEYVQAWIEGFINSLSVESSNGIEVNIKSLRTKLSSKIPKGEFPISIILWNKIKEQLLALEKEQDKASIAEIRAALIKAFQGFQTDISSKKKELNQAYKEAKNSYKVLKEDDLNPLLMSAGELEDWLAEFSEEVHKKSEEEQKELEKEQKELERQYQKYVVDYTSLLGHELNAIKITNPQSLSDTLNMDMKLLFRNLSTALDSDNARNTPISKDLWAFVNENLSSEPYYEMEDVRDQLNRWCKNLGSKSVWYDEQFEFWKDKQEGFPSAALIAAAVNDAYIDIDADTIRQHLIEWTKSVKDAFVLSKNYTIVIEKAQKNFKELFQEESNKGISTLFFYEDLLKILFQQNGEKTRLDQLKNTTWEKALLQVIEKERVANYFGQWRLQYGPYAVKAFNEELDTLLPTTEEIQQALLKSVERKEKLLIPEITIDTLRIDLVISSSKIEKHTNRKKLLVDLAYKNYPISKDGKLLDILTVVPTNILVEEGSNKESKSKVELVNAKIRKTETHESGSATTTIRLTFMAVTDIEKLFNSVNMKDLDYKGYDLSSLLKKINGGVSVKGAGVMMGVEDFIYQSTNVEYFEVEFTVGSALVNGKDRVIELQTGLSCNDNTFQVTFSDGSQFLQGATFLKP
ncbi:MAG: hypothetical protein ACRBFS_20865, partial [Aureispira sp.]